MDGELNDREKQRQEGFKQGISAADNRRRREETTVSIRKNKKNEQLKKRRNMGRDATQDDKQVAAAAGLCLIASGQQKVANMDEYMNGLRSTDPNVVIEATTMIRKLLSIEKDPPIEEVINAGAVPILVEMLKAIDYPNLQFEAAWALTNITSTKPEYTRVVIEANAVHVLVELLKVNAEDVREQAAWCLGNIAGDNVQCRDYVLQYGIMEGLLLNLNHPETTITMLRTATWVLSNLCRGKPQPPWQAVRVAIPTLEKLIQHTDPDVLTDALWALSYLSDGPDENIQEVIDAGVIKRTTVALESPKVEVKIPALRTIGNIVTGSDQQTQAVINHGVLRKLKPLLDDSMRPTIRKETCWTIANITAGSRSQIQEVFQTGIIADLIHILQTDNSLKTKKEAAWAVSNITTGGSEDQMRQLAAQGAIEALCCLLSLSDVKAVQVALEGLSNLLAVGKSDSMKSGVNHFAVRMDECGGLDQLDELQTHANRDVYKKAASILETYFSGEDDENAAPALAGNQFAFNSPAIVPQFAF